MKTTFLPGDAILLVDVQNDFFPGGSLGVIESDQIIPTLNYWLEKAKQANIPVFASRDWHPADHISFKQRGGPWPAHCVQNTRGAAFHSQIRIPHSAIIISKAFEQNKDSYSAFEGISVDKKTLADYIRELRIKRLWIGGLAQDYCVLASTLDACKITQLQVIVDLNATRPVALETGEKAKAAMLQAGALLMEIEKQ